MKKVAVIGLGIIGGSICASLTKAGIQVDGTDKDESAVKYALAKGYIQGIATDIFLYDVVFIAIPPMATISVLETEKFKDGALVSDICGVKSIVENAVYKQDRNYRYVAIHPMAGKETSGISSATPNLFEKANLIIAVSEHTKTEDLNEVREYAKAMRTEQVFRSSS